ncbi:MAG TPA: hypothetical protein PKA90_11270 [Ignavibacteria bacterium]|nr:hypothetical protein [Ignavibacteria bacterium]HMR40998.1 hypothetical protein [Ignavibacteria bacterium]
MSIRSRLHYLSDLLGAYDILIFLMLVSFGWVLAWISFIVLAIFFAR